MTYDLNHFAGRVPRRGARIGANSQCPLSAYDADERRLVLEQRERVAFRDGVLEDVVIAMCAAYGAKDSGDARKTLDLRLKTGDVARESGSDVVTETHVQEARERV